ncbi:hypothetical protein BJV74DRAFT_886270 [Russula compacta]|nr:hypothetical protein BJV74DRAFT_886270 [Russula compacta]
MNSPSPLQEDVLRRLPDQRVARADFHHTTSPSLTQYPDSPSIYSHFSPRPPHLDSTPPQFDFVVPPQYARPSLDAVRSLASSTTDTHCLDTDSTNSTTDILPERCPSAESINSEDDGSEPRMSFLGPTMRFHSPAPWETDDNVKGGVEQEDDARSFVTKRNRSKTRGDGFMKSFGRSGPAKATSTTRPSMESTNSKDKDKVSADSQLAAPNLHTQPQATVSAASLATSSSRPSRPGLIFSRGRSRTVSHTSSSDTSIPPPPPVSPSAVLGSMYASATSSVPARSTSPAPSMYSSTLSPTDVTDISRSTSPLSLQGRPDFVHPYANPDLAYDAGPVRTATSFLPTSSLGRHTIFPSDSIATVSESVVSQSSSTLTPDSSMSSVTDYHTDVLLKKVSNGVQGKVISSPLSATAIAGHQGHQDKGQPALPNHVPGWPELPVSPTFNLISLQEAQAQAKERSRTHTQVIPDAPFLQTEPPSRNNLTPLPSNTGRMRSRTASASSKGKIEPLVISNPLPLPQSAAESQLATVGTTGSLPRSLKQKKSGFLRLFNGKDKDKDKLSTPSPPPAPPVAAPPISRTPKISSSRVPVPSLSPLLVSQSPLQFDGIVKGDGGENDSVEEPQDQRITERQGPALSIFTLDVPPSASSPGTQSAGPGVRSTSLIPGINPDLGLSPASAPPSTTMFSGLSLRPISTVFSAHFSDHIVSFDSPPTAQTDSSGSGTTANGSSTFSPDSAQRSSDEKHATEDDPYLVIQQLQEQMMSTRKAWQHQIWELEGQVRDLRAEIDELRLKELRGERCLLCGRTDEPDRGTGEVSSRSTASRSGVVDRPRARVGVGSTRFAT